MFSFTSNRTLMIGLLTLMANDISLAEENMRLHGVLLEAPPCVIQDDSVIDVFFGNNVGIHRVDGINYTQDIQYKLVCQPNSKGWILGLSVVGPQSTFDSAALQTNVDNLAIRLTQDGEPFEINTRLVISPNSPPALKAVPIKRPGSELSKGEFSVVATLLAEYQ